MAIYRKGIETKFGRFVIEANEAGISRVVFPHNAAKLADTPSSCAVIHEAEIELKNYFSGQTFNFAKLTYDFSEVTDFQEKILRTLLSSTQPTLAYSTLAEMSGYPQSSRAVGTAMNKNPFPILIPCHRVIQANGEIGQYAFGVAWKKKLLEHEKIATASLATI